MKKTLLFALLFLTDLSLTLGQNIDTRELPEKITCNFNTDYPQADKIVWEKVGDNFGVTFSVKNSQEVHLVYNEGGNLLERYMALPKKDIPVNINTYIKVNYAFNDIKDIWVRQKEDRRIYKVELSSNNNTGRGYITGTSGGLTAVESKEAILKGNNSPGELIDSLALSAETNNASQTVYFDSVGNLLSMDGTVLQETIIKSGNQVVSKDSHAARRSRRRPR